jgi:uncharacterized protein (DUF433 family)
MLADGIADEEILRAFPDLELDDVHEVSQMI